MLSNYLSPINKLRFDSLKEKLKIDGSLELTVKSDSMVPTLNPGHPILIQEAHIKIGDVIGIFLVSGDIMVHRFLGIINGLHLTKGDNSSKYELTMPSMLIGRVQTQHNWVKISRAYIQNLLFQYIRNIKNPDQKKTVLKKKLRNHSLVHSYSFTNSVTQIVFFDVYSQNLLSLANQVLRCWGDEVNFQTREFFTLTKEEARKLLSHLYDPSIPWDNETCVRAFFACNLISPERTEILIALSEVILTKSGQNKRSSLLELVDIISNGADCAPQNEIDNKIV